MGEEFLNSLVHRRWNRQTQSSSVSTEDGDYTQQGIPKVFSGALLHDGWPACRLWTSENSYQRLKEILPSDTMVEVMQSSPSTDTTISLFKGSGSSLQTIHMRFIDFIESSDVGLYLAQAPLVVFTDSTAHTGILYGLSEDVKIPSMMPQGCDIVSVNAWCSGRGRVLSSLHYDCHENLLCVVEGEKTVRLAPFDTVPTSCLFYEHPYEWGYGNHTDSYTLFPEYTGRVGSPRALDAACVETHHLVAGDVMYIPKGYWHQVLSGNKNGRTMAINFWWDTESETNPAFASLVRENERIAAHGLRYLIKRAEQSKHDIVCILSQPKTASLDMIQQTYGTGADEEARVLAVITHRDIFCAPHNTNGMEAMVAYAFSRGFDVFYRYLVRISMQENLTRWMWQHATPTTIEYLTSGLTHLAEDEDTSDLYRTMYSHLDTLEHFQRTLESRKMQFKSFLATEADTTTEDRF